MNDNKGFRGLGFRVVVKHLSTMSNIIWACAILTCCKHAYKLMSQATLYYMLNMPLLMADHFET